MQFQKGTSTAPTSQDAASFRREMEKFYPGIDLSNTSCRSRMVELTYAHIYGVRAALELAMSTASGISSAIYNANRKNADDLLSHFAGCLNQGEKGLRTVQPTVDRMIRLRANVLGSLGL